MNTHYPEAISSNVAAETPAASEPPFQLRRVLLGMVMAAALADVCFWNVNGAGFSVGLFFPALAMVILLSRKDVNCTRMTVLLYALLAGASLAAMIESGIANIIVLVVLIVAIAGNSYFTAFENPWARWYAQSVALALAPGRIPWLIAKVKEAIYGGGRRWTRVAIAGCLLCIPALLLALLFGSLLASANAVFGSWANAFFEWAWKEITLCLNFGRIAFWVAIAFLALPFIRPTQIPFGWWNWIPRLPRLPELVARRGAIFSSALVLVVLNVVFLGANVADAMFLWSGAALPAGVDYKSYVHDGVDTLICTVILTAIVLTVIFQQELAVSRHRLLKTLALIWIAQNLFLLANCALRLKHYIEDYELTIARESCLIFLALVATAFVLLTVKILREHSIAWLVGGCLLAVFVTFYITQFLDLYGWSANYNVARYEKNRYHRVDLRKLYEAGPAAWPAARRAHRFDSSIDVLNHDTNLGPDTDADATKVQFDVPHWREFSLRAYWNRWALDDKK
jgi:hypothetical protein